MAATSQNKDLFNDYEGFVSKFSHKKTTDDCYTPQELYKAVYEWVDKNIISLHDKLVIRPFYPGGDYENYHYPNNCIVLDNPPFSILSKICRFYNEHEIPYFLFAPHQTLFSTPIACETYIVAGLKLVYENGAKVSTSFRTNVLCGEPKIIVSGELYSLLQEVQGLSKPPNRRKVLYPDNLCSAARLGKIASGGVDLIIPASQCYFVRKLDMAEGFNIYGGGYLISEKVAAEKLAAEKLAAEKLATIEVPLSNREIKIIRELSCLR